MTSYIMGLAVPESLLPWVPTMSIFLLLLLTIVFLTLCASCRQSFDLQDVTTQTRSQIRVIKLEEVPEGQENPTAGYLTMDEIVVQPPPGSSFVPTSTGPAYGNNVSWRNHLKAPSLQVDTDNAIPDGLNYRRESTDPVTWNLRVQRIPLEQNMKEASAPVVSPQQEMESVLQSDHPLATPNQSENHTGLSQLNHVTITPQNPYMQHLQNPKVAEDQKPPFVFYPSTEEELDDPMYNTVIQPNRHVTLPSRVSDPQPIGGAHFLTPQALLEEGRYSLADSNLNALYAQVNKKHRNRESPPPPPQPPPDFDEDYED